LRELLQAHAQRRDVAVTEKVEGILSVTLDAQMRVVAAKVLDGSVDAAVRASLEQAIVEAVNRGMTRVVQTATEALQGLQQSAEWRQAAEDIARRMKRPA
jgi:DNA-binding protein YbaB